MYIAHLTVNNFRAHVVHVLSLFDAPHNQLNLDTMADMWEPLITSGLGQVYANEAGFLCALFLTDPMSGESTAVQYLWLGKGDTLSLFREFEKEARKRKCVRALSGCMVFSDVPRMRAIYKRLGYSPFSESFSKVL